MEIAVYSNDPELCRICQNIATHTPDGQCSVRSDFRVPPTSPTDVCIYDSSFVPLEELPEFQRATSAIVVVSRAELSQIRTKTLHLRAIVLLRPLNRALLEIAIEQSLCRPVYTVDCDLIRMNRDQLLEGLLHASLRLQDYDQGRAHFLGRAIYELRAPLTSIQGYCRLLLDGKVGPLAHEQAIVMGRMWRNVERLNRFVSTIFDLSVGRGSEARPNYRAGNIVDCVEAAIQEMEPMLRDRRIEVLVKVTPPEGILCFHEIHIEQVIVNLLDNSCRFTGRGGTIRIAAYPYFWDRPDVSGTLLGHRPHAAKPPEVFNSYRIDVSDNGPAIPHDLLERTFADSSEYGGAHDRSGTGLGLAIARMLVQQHHGHVWVESKEPTGATFCVVLPYTDSHAIFQTMAGTI
jgi:signal transduction histidine kinase